MKILVLYEELAWYFINCVNETAERHGAKILIICRKANPVAPFKFPFVHPDIEICVRDEHSEAELISVAQNFGPQVVLTGGWSNKLYLKLVKQLKSTAAIAFDNHWNGSLRQRLGALYFRLFLKPHVQTAFIPGPPQRSFAQKLGFETHKIREGFYCCDHGLYTQYHEKHRAEKERSFPKRFLYVGRYANEKGVRELWNAFIEWQNKNPNKWELWCLGKGDLTPPPHEKIKHFGFLQPDQLDGIIRNTGVFVLPSRFEPWGVVVHEFAAAGYPLLVSRESGAGDTFCREGLNGYRVQGGSKQQLIEKMNTFSSLTDKDLLSMSRESVRLAATLTPSVWAERFMTLFKT